MSTPDPGPDTQLSHRARRPLDRSRVRAAVDGPNHAAAVRLLQEALVAGDRTALLELSRSLLQQPGALKLSGWSHVRVLVTRAATMATLPTTLGEVAAYGHAVRENLTIVELDLGFEAFGRLDDLRASVKKAQEQANRLSNAAARVAGGSLHDLPELCRSLIMASELDLADALVRAGLPLGQAWAGAVGSSQLRTIGLPNQALETCEAVLEQHPRFAPSMNSACGALVDRGEAATGIRRYLLPSLAIAPNRHAGNTGRRAFRKAGRPEQAARCDELAQAHGPDRVSKDPMRCRAIAIEILRHEGAEHLALEPLLQVRSAAERGRVTPQDFHRLLSGLAIEAAS